MKTKFSNALSLALIMAMLVTSVALASEVAVAVVDITVPTNSVTLAPGTSGAITIIMTVTGNQAGTATFEVYRDWELSGGTFSGSNPQEFTVGPRGGGDPATIFSTSGTVTIHGSQTAGGPFTLAVSAFDITNSNNTGGKLADGADSNYQVTVSAPPPPPADTTPPSITPSVTGTLGNNGWYVSDVTVSWTVNDPESTVSSSSGCGSTTINSDTSISGTTLTCSATSAGGTNSQSVTIKRDATAPTASASASPAPNANGWNNSDVIVSFSGSDALSGIDSCSSAVVLSSEGAGQSASGTCTDNAGNVSAFATASGINIDKTAPTASASASPAPNANGWNNTDVTVSFSGSDGLSGIDSCTAPIVLSNDGAGQSASGSCTDKAGNGSSSATVTGINIDKTAPSLSPSVSPNPVVLNGSATASPNATDATSGVASSSCDAVDTSSVGTHSVNCTATDFAGNTNSASASYSVVYNWNGFFQPIDNLPILNKAKAGSAIPVKFSLSGYQGLNIFWSSYPVSTLTACGTTTTDTIETTVTAGSSSLSYDATTDQYVYVWKTDKSWAGTCRTLTVKLIDGTIHQANFNFTK